MMMMMIQFCCINVLTQQSKGRLQGQHMNMRENEVTDRVREHDHNF